MEEEEGRKGETNLVRESVVKCILVGDVSGVAVECCSIEVGGLTELHVSSVLANAYVLFTSQEGKVLTTCTGYSAAWSQLCSYARTLTEPRPLLLRVFFKLLPMVAYCEALMVHVG